MTAVVADAEYGDNSTVRQTLHRRLPYALGISPTLTVFLGTPVLRVDRRQRQPRNRREGWPDQEAVSVRTLSDALPAPGVAAGRRGTTEPIRRGPPISRRSVSRRPATGGSGGSRQRSGCSANVGSADGPPQTLLGRDARVGLARALVRLAHQRWAIEQHYQDLKTELGLDHFEGRKLSGLAAPHGDQRGRLSRFSRPNAMRPRRAALTFPQVRAIVQEVFTGLLFISRPQYVQWIKDAEQAKHQLRI